MQKRIESFRDLVAWQKAMDVVDSIYLLSQSLPRREIFGLTSQMRRSAVSIPSNLAEGYGRHRSGDYLRFIDVARGSLAELQTQVLVCHRQSMLSQQQLDEVWAKMDEVSRLLYGLSASLQNRIAARNVVWLGMAGAVLGAAASFGGALTSLLRAIV